MSDYYFKKVIKDNSEDKKNKKYNDKEEFDMGYKKDKECHDQCEHKCEHHKEEEASFIEFDVSESTRIVFPSVPGVPGGTPLPLDTLATVKVDVEDDDNKVLLEGTVEWTPGDVGLIAAIVALIVGGTLGVPLAIEGTFRIWRSTDNSPFVPIFETTDSSSVSSLIILGLVATDVLTLPFSTTTTSFHWVDENPSCGENRYFLTLDLSLAEDPTIDLGAVLGTGLLSSFLAPLTSSVETKVLTAIEIKED
ncbi:hypothetical protein C2I27_20345 [Priestia megaterium]|uniref:hypothetical protein n=1 Tax=Priestia TaxID=2800373 RepID=UPI000D524B7A|nr:hypothetical protein [Priestia megaterium]PVC64660.1 hypothetical protein C2I27_20345 [Priestia megaterium]